MTDPSADLYRVVGFQRYPAGRPIALFRAPGSTEALLFERQELDPVLRALMGPARTLEEHAPSLDAALCSTLGMEPDALLGALVTAGFLVSAATLQQRVGRSLEEPAPIRGLGFVTRDRFRSLQRCVISFARNLRDYGRSSVDLAIMDDSVSDATRTRTQAMLGRLSRAYGIRVVYAGIEEKRAFRDALSRESGVEPDLVAFALANPDRWPFAAGANRNILQLQMSGSPYLSFDDDEMCRLAAAPDEQSGLTLGGPTEAWFYRSGEEMRAESKWIRDDFVGLHERFLGRDARGCLAEWAPAEIDISHLDPQLLSRLETGGVVTHTWNGLVGDNWYAPDQCYLQGWWHARLQQSPDLYRSAMASRQVFFGITRFGLSVPRNTGRIVGLAATRLPPYPPVARAEDSSFSALLRDTHRDGVMGLLPRAPLHAPVPTRSFLYEAFWPALHTYAARDLIETVLQAPRTAALATLSDPRQRMARIGDSLVDLGRRRSDDFDRAMRLTWSTRQCALLSRAELRLSSVQDHDGPWADDTRRLISELERAIADTDSRAAHLVDGPQGDVGFEPLRRFFSSYGELLRAWPALVDASVRLRDRGITPGRVL